MADALVSVHGLIKDYQSLRPLRLQELDLEPGQSLAIVGLDASAAEVLVNLLTGAILPDQGAVTVLGRDTASIADADAWVEALDAFGLISERAVFLEELTAEQNLALPLSLAINDLSAELRQQVEMRGGEVGLTRDVLAMPVARLDPLNRQRLRLGRALALDPRVVLAEHPNAPLSSPDTHRFADDFARVVAARGCAALILTADRDFAARIAPIVLAHQPSSGLLRPATGWRRFLP